LPLLRESRFLATLEMTMRRARCRLKEIDVRKFKAQCLAIMDQVLTSGEPVLITKHGKPVARLVPAQNDADDIFGYMADKVKVVGDIVGPITPLEDWETK